MASDVDNVFAATPRATGTVLRAPRGTALPTSAWTTPNVAFVDMGYIGEDGYTQSHSRDTDKKKAFGGTTVKVLQTDYSETYQFAFLESTKVEVLEAIYGEDNVSVSGDGEISVNKNKLQSENASWILDTVDGDKLNRVVIPNGKIIEQDDVQKVHTEVVMFTVTIEAFEDASGNNSYEYTAPALVDPTP